MKVNQITLLAILSTALAGSFFSDSKSDKIKADLQSLGADILDESGKFRDSVLDKLDPTDLQEWISAHTKDVVSPDEALAYAKKHANWFADDVQDYFANAKEGADAILNKGSKYYEQAAEGAAEAFDDHVAKGQEHYEEATGFFADAISSFNANLEEAVKNGQDYLSSFKDAVFEKWSDSEIKEFLSLKGVKNTENWTREQLLELGNYVKSTANDLNVEGWKSNIVDQAQEVHKNVKDNVESAQKVAEDASEGVFDKINNIGKQVGDSAKQFVGKVQNSFEGHKQAGQDKVQEAAKDIESFNKWSIDELKNYVQDFGGSFKQNKDSLIQAAKQKFLSQKPKSKFDALKEKASELFGSLNFFRNDL